MANQAAKKAKRTSASVRESLKKFIIPTNILHFAVRFLWFYTDITRWTILGSALLAGMLYLSHSWVVAAAEEGTKSEYAMDILILTLVVQAGVTFSAYFWLIYLAIPAFICYHLGRMIVNYVFQTDETDQEDSVKAAKKKAKADKKASKIRYSRR
uniref:AlNc14C105G6184 protein n=1 Tax=Albugo laibachii Nc14 TaxID=890382 RepID=F0WHX7_9STRA|nr:AlNc14C105G6184 [Albugo laibachii Nc14]|eukprot:CCA20854.1 AlNc14C105G6184 [Albugo laibachii Nc14]